MPMTMRIGNENHPRAFALSDDGFLVGEKVLAQLVDELMKQLLLSLGIVVVVRQDVAPDFDLLTGF